MQVLGVKIPAGDSIGRKSGMGLIPKSFYFYRRFFKLLLIFFSISGPGIIVMIADNDAGGITTYAVTGAKYGYGLIWFLILLGPLAYCVQEMTVRLGAVTKRGFAEAIFDAFGSFWGWFAFLNLALTNWLTLVTEFVGMTAALSIFHVPPLATVILVSVVMGAMVLQGSYWTWEKIALVLCVANLIYIPAAFIVRPSVSSILREGFIPNFPGGFGNTIFFFLMANIGTTIAPWMIFFQQSAVVDKGFQEKDIRWGRIDTMVGAFFTVLVAVFIVIMTGTVLKGLEINNAVQAARVIMEKNPYVGACLAIGLFDAGFLGAICISLSSSWSLGEVFGWAHSLNNKIREAPWFYACYFLALATAGAVVLIPRAPLVLITLFVQVFATTLLPTALVFLMLLLNNQELMGQYKNTRFQNAINSIIVVGLIILSALYGISALFPGVFN